MKYLLILLLFTSCSPKILPELIIPAPEPIETVDTVQPIIYEIVEQPKDKKILNEHTFTMLVDKIYTLIATTIAILIVDDTNP